MAAETSARLARDRPRPRSQSSRTRLWQVRGPSRPWDRFPDVNVPSPKRHALHRAPRWRVFGHGWPRAAATSAQVQAPFAPQLLPVPHGLVIAATGQARSDQRRCPGLDLVVDRAVAPWCPVQPKTP
ncbi:MAG: hypothetical protein EB017_10335 [Betaproteobacteria bacterium]|nr:hypothetical protein [Betaproteobacteria bacterium]